MPDTLNAIAQALERKGLPIGWALPGGDSPYSERSQRLKHFATLQTGGRMAVLLPVWQALRQAYPDELPLFIHEDVGQCLYTSGHAEENKDFYFDQQTYMARHGERDVPLARYRFVLDRLNDPKAQLRFEDCLGVLNYTDPCDLADLQKLLQEPTLPVDAHVPVYLIPGHDSGALFARMINGYFHGDLQPRQCYALIRHLLGRYGYVFIGIGANTLLFTREIQPDVAQASALLHDLARLYGLPPDALQACSAAVCHQPLLMLPYLQTLRIAFPCG